jgi:iron complex transport system substrate-binding protein
MDPLISGIGWVKELIEIAGGNPIFPELSKQGLARERVVDMDDVIRADPDLIIASWCGKRVNIEAIRRRPGWYQINAVRNNRIHEIKSMYILQPGPAALTEGLNQLHQLISKTARAMNPS